MRRPAEEEKFPPHFPALKQSSSASSLPSSHSELPSHSQSKGIHCLPHLKYVELHPAASEMRKINLVLFLKLMDDVNYDGYRSTSDTTKFEFIYLKL